MMSDTNIEYYHAYQIVSKRTLIHTLNVQEKTELCSIEGGLIAVTIFG